VKGLIRYRCGNSSCSLKERGTGLLRHNFLGSRQRKRIISDMLHTIVERRAVLSVLFGLKWTPFSVCKTAIEPNPDEFHLHGP